MIVSNQQKDVSYFKEYPCYSRSTHLSQKRQQSFVHATYIHFNHNTYPKHSLPKHFIDKYQSPHQMYWLEWTLQNLEPSLIAQGQLRLDTNRNSNASNLPHSSIPSRQYKCLYIAHLGQLAHIKLVFNSDPEIVAICQDFLYTIGGNQLIVTQLWPQTLSSSQVPSESQIPPKQSQIIHQLDHGSTVLSLDFVYDQEQGAICKVIYLHQKKGIYSQVYRKNQLVETSLINKLFDLSLKFKKNEKPPIFYQTLVPNILGLIIHNATEFSLFNLTEMKPIQSTRKTLDGWQLNHHQQIIVKCTVNDALENYNDCLNIVIGQGENVEIFLYHISYSSTAVITSQKDEEKRFAYDLKNYPIHMFTSGEFINFEKSILNHFTLIHLEKITHLQNFILNSDGIIYLGYHKNDQMDENQISDEIPITGFIDYLKPYITHEILMQENKIWKEYKLDILRDSTEQRTKTNAQTLERLLIPGRYEKQFVQKILKLEEISDLTSFLETTNESLAQIHQRLVFQWRNQYKFVEFVIYKSQILVIRRNSIGTLIPIDQQQFLGEKDPAAEQQVSYNQILSRGFSVHFDLEGERYIDQEYSGYRIKKGESQRKLGLVLFTGKSYEDKLQRINAILQNIGDEQFLRQDRVGNNLPYFDQQQIQRQSLRYRQAKCQLIYLSTQHNTETLPEHHSKVIEQSMISAIHQPEPVPQKNYLELHISILSLRVKDVLLDLINTMKVNYHSYYSHATSPKQSKDHPVTLQQLQILHLQHMYLVFVMEWVLKLGTKYHLQQQYATFGHDLIERFVLQYMTKFCDRSSIQKGSRSHKIPSNFFKEDLEYHVSNILALIFRGLLKDILPHADHLKNDNFLLNNVLDPHELPQQDLTKLQIEKINRNANTFLLMLLKTHQSKSYESKFITEDLIRMLFNPLIFKPFNPNIQKFIPINKTFVYSILSMPLTSQEKKRILACHIDKKQFMSLLLLIQLENNCYLSLEEGLQVQIYQNNPTNFEYNTIKLGKQNCCIIEDLILTHYKLFLFLNESSVHKKIPQNIKSAISSPQFEQQAVIYNQNQCIEFIKNLFSSIEFRYLTAVLMQDKKSFQQGQFSGNGHSGYENKSIAETYRQLIDEVDHINETYGCSKDSKIDRAFKKFFYKVYQEKSKQHTNTFVRGSNQEFRPTSGTYPEMTGLDYKLSKWELNMIEKLYKKHLKVLRMEKKDSFQSVSIIQQRLNLEYSMIKIYLFRIKLIMEEMPNLDESERQNYARVMKIFVQGLRGSLNLFKKWRADLSSEDKEAISDEEVLQALAQIDHMENSRFYGNNCDQLSSYETLDQKVQNWKILGISFARIGLPITSKWLRLLSLTLAEDSSQQIFTNYGSIDNVLMKILTVIKHGSLAKERQELTQLFGEKIINSLISQNKHLSEIYNERPQPTRQSSLYNNYQRNRGLLSGSNFTQRYTSNSSLY